MTASLRSVAARAGVSVRTVSNVVGHHPQVAPATRAAVQAAIDELGYRPNLAARQLRRGRTGAVALVLPDVHSPTHARLTSAVVRHAAARGLSVLIHQTEGDPEHERRPLGGSSFTVDGIIMSPGSLSVAELADGAGDLPLVVLGERVGRSDTDHVGFDTLGAARTATAHLVSLGRRRIAAVGNRPHLTTNTGRQRLAGFHLALRAAGLAADPRLEVAVRGLHRADGLAAMSALLDGPVVPDAVFCFTDELALGALRAIADRGLRVPEDIAVVGFDDTDDGRYSVPGLTTIAADTEQVVAGCLDALTARVQDRSAPGTEVLVRHELVVRGSTVRT